MISYKLMPNIKNGFISCYEAALSSVLYNTFPDYASVFALFWGFNYKLPSENAALLKDRFGVGGLCSKYSDYCRELFGLTLCQNRTDDVRQFFDILKHELSEKRTVILSIDTFQCIWNIGYKKFHLEHFIVITGYDEESSSLLCHDSFCEMQEAVLSIKTLDMMGTIKFFTHVLKEKEKTINNDELLSQAAAFYLYEEKSYSNIIAFSAELENNNLYGDLQTSDLTVLCLDAFFIKLKGFAASRLNLLYFLNEIEKRQEIKSAAHYLEEACSYLKNAFLLLIKAMSRKGDRTYMKNAADFIYQSAILEKKAAEALLYSVSGD